MTGILIVDDELIVRVGIKSMINWPEEGFKIVGEACDGVDALDKIRELSPAILLTDIKMPRMDGIELIKIVKEKYSAIKIVVLSCYNDFELVKQAMKYGASDYILKLSMTQDELLQVVKGIKKQMDDDNRRVKGMNHLQQKINSNMDVIKEKFFKKIINGSYANAESIYADAKALNIRFYKGSYLVMNISLCHSSGTRTNIKLEPDLLKYAVMNIIEEILPKELQGDVYADSQKNFAVIFVVNDCDYREIHTTVEAFANRVHSALEVYLNVYSAIGICDRFETSLEGIQGAYSDALAATQHIFYHRGYQLFRYSELDYSATPDKYLNGALMKKITTCLEVGNIEETMDIINGLFSEVMENKDMRSEDVRKTLMHIANIFLRMSGKYTTLEVGSQVFDMERRISQIDTLDNIFDSKEWFENFISDLAVRCNERPKSLYSKKIGELKAYIYENFDKDISLEQASAFLNIGKNYFCSIFKKETGMTYNDYLIYVKMEKAKEFLKSFDMRNNEIALKLGYDNSYYFSTVFKKVVGVSPSGYKKAYRK